MSAPLIFIILPGFFSTVLFTLQRFSRLNQVSGAAISLILVLLAWRLPIDTPIFLGVPGLPPLVISNSLTFLGRRFFLDNSLRPLMGLIYFVVSLWLVGSFAVKVSQLFVPLILGMGALITASVAVEPPLYAALFIVLTAMISIPIFSPPGKPASSAAMRLLIFQLIGMGLFLFADWFLSSFQTAPEDFHLLTLAVAFFGLGLAFLAGIFPFHTWIPMLAESAYPYAASIVIFLIPFTASLAGLRYLSDYSSLDLFPGIQVTLRTAGVLMVLVAGVWAAMERHLGRIMGFAAMIQVGNTILAFSLANQPFQSFPLPGIIISFLIPQAIALVVWSISLSILVEKFGDEPAGSLRFHLAQGSVSLYPFAVIGLLLANFSLAGLPLLANFPGLIILGSAIADTSTISSTLLWIGHAGLLIAGLRTFAVLTMDPQERSWQISENRLQVLWLVIGMVILLVLGIAP